MKLTLIKKNSEDKNSIYIPLYTNPPYQEVDDIYLISSEKYEVCSENDTDVISICIDNVDYSFDKLKDIYGFVRLRVERNGTMYFTRLIDVRVNKDFYNNYIKEMYNYLFKNKNYIQHLFNYSKNTFFPTSEVLEYKKHISFFVRIINTYKENYVFFKSLPIKKDDYIFVKDDFYKATNIDHNIVEYICSHSSEMKQSKKGIKVGDKYFCPDKVKTRKINYVYDVYENQVIMSFLDICFNEIKKYYAKFKERVAYAKQTNRKHISVPMCLWAEQYNGLGNNEFENLIFQMDLVIKKFSTLFPVTKINIVSPIRATQKFLQTHHYTAVFRLIKEFFEVFQINNEKIINEQNNFCRIFKSDDLYEMYSLCFILNYFKKKTGEIWSFDDSGKWTLDCNGKIISVFFQFKVQDNIQDNKEDIFLYKNNNYKYSWKYGFLKSNGKHVEPDFIISVEDRGFVNYYILDAKFSDYKTVMKYSVPEIIIKYGIGISVSHQQYNKKTFVGVVFGKWDKDSESEMFLFPDSDKSSDTIYFATELSPRVGEEELERLFHSLFDK